MYISYSGSSRYVKCEFSYWHQDVNKTPPPKLENRVNMLYGSTVGMAFEHFYNERMWRNPEFLNEMLARVPGYLRQVILSETREGRNGLVNWSDPKANYKSEEAVIEDVRSAIPRGIRSIRHHRLVGTEVTAELKLDSKIGEHILGGRADFVIKQLPPQADMIILDGKGSKFRDRYVDHRQLLWYAMLFREQRGMLPNKLGFLYWRSEPETSLDWIPCEKKEVDNLKATALDMIETIEAKRRSLPIAPKPTPEMALQVFPAQPSADCRWCTYLPICDAGTRYQDNKGKAPDLSDVGSDDQGVGDVGI